MASWDDNVLLEKIIFPTYDFRTIDPLESEQRPVAHRNGRRKHPH